MFRLQQAARLNAIAFSNGRRSLASGHGHGHGHGKEHGHGHGHDDHGHEHGHDDHHHEPFEVPHYSRFNNWQSSPELVAHQTRLQAIGLNDPWIRNLVWLYEPRVKRHWGWPKFKRSVFGGIKYGVYVAVPAILATEGYYYYKKSKEGEGDEHGHH